MQRNLNEPDRHQGIQVVSLAIRFGVISTPGWTIASWTGMSAVGTAIANNDSEYGDSIRTGSNVLSRLIFASMHLFEVIDCWFEWWWWRINRGILFIALFALAALLLWSPSYVAFVPLAVMAITFVLGALFATRWDSRKSVPWGINTPLRTQGFPSTELVLLVGVARATRVQVCSRA